MKGIMIRKIVRPVNRDITDIMDKVGSKMPMLWAWYNGETLTCYVLATEWQVCKMENEFRLEEAGIYKERMLRREMFF